MKRSFRIILSFVLAMIMALSPSMSAYAQGTNQQYLSDVRIGYGESGKKALKDAGYTVLENFNANEGGNGDAVYIGYMTSQDEEDAITDLAVMNMNGAYSFGAWADEIAAIEADVDALLKKFTDTVSEFQENYKNGNPYTTEAVKALAYFKDDYSGKTLDEIILGDDQSALENVFVKGNVKIISTIEQVLAVGVTEYGEDGNFLSRLGEYEFGIGEIEEGDNEKRMAVFNVIDDLKKEVQEAEALIASYEETGIDADDEEALEDLTDQQLWDYAEAYTLLEILKNASYTSDLDMTFYDFVMLEEWEDVILEPLAQCLTEGQLGILETVGLTVLIENAAGAGDEEAAASVAEQFATLSEIEGSVSVYAGVDTSLYDEPESVAMTLAARQTDGDEASFGEEDDIDYDMAIFSCSVISGLCLAVAAVGIKTAMKTVEVLVEKVATKTFSCFIKGESYVVGTKKVAQFSARSVGAVMAYVAIAVAVILAVVAIVMAVLKNQEKTVDQIDYTEVPRALIDGTTDVESATSRYITYYAALRADATEGSSDSTLIYGDLNGYNGVNQWYVLYYSKDPALGEPLTGEFLGRNETDLTLTDGYVAVHDFDSDAPANLNQFNSGTDRKAVYLYVKCVAEESVVTGSSFSTTTNVLLGVGCFALGAVFSALLTSTARKKKATA